MYVQRPNKVDSFVKKSLLNEKKQKTKKKTQ